MSPKTKDAKIPIGWVKITLPNAWFIYAPSSFRLKRMNGIDSQPGVLISDSLGLNIEFDSGRDLVLDDNCDFDSRRREAENDIDSGVYYMRFGFPNKHKATIDTIDGLLAVLINPLDSEEGEMGVSLSDCVSWIGFRTFNVNPQNRPIVMAMFQTIKLTR